MDVIIGVDPHKASHTAVAIDDGEDELARMQVRSDREPGRPAVGVGGAVRAADVGDRGRRRARLPAGPAARRRRRARRRRAGDAGGADPAAGQRAGRTRTTRTTRCRSRSPRCGTGGLRPVEPVGHSEVLRLLAKRNIDIGEPTHPARVAAARRCWSSSHRAGSPRKSTLLTSTRSSHAVTPTDPVEQVRYDLAVELLDDIRRLDAQLKAVAQADPRRGRRRRARRSPTCSGSGRSSPRC